MAISAAQQRAKEKWDKKNLDRIQLVVRAGEKEMIRAAAEASGESLNHYIVMAVKARMMEEGRMTADEDENMETSLADNG